jgi:hypothetical protein
MRKLLTICLFSILLVSSSAAQSTKGETADLILELYEKVGPGLGCLLFEPDIFLTLSGQKAASRWIRDAVVSEADEAAVESLNRILEPYGSRLVLDDQQRLYAESLVGLRQSALRSRLPWMEPFDIATGWSGYSRWRSKQRAKLDDESLELLVFLYGIPDSAVSGRGLEKDLIASSMRISTDLPYSEVLMNEGVNFRVSPEDAVAPDVLEATERMSRELRDFYLDSRVRKLIRTPEFLQARRERRPTLGVGDRSEKWLRGDYDVWSVFQVASTLGVSVEQERVLIESIGELEKRVRAGQTPDEWSRWLGAENNKLGNAPLDGSVIRTWLWHGAYPQSSAARQKFYRAVKEVAPGYIAGLAAHYLEGWLDEDGAYDERTYVLLSHPDIKTTFEGLGDPDKERVRSILSRSDDLLIRALAQEAPYAP